MKIELAWQRILDAYGNKGYLDAALEKLQCWTMRLGEWPIA